MQMNWQLSANENQSALTHTVSQKMTNSDISNAERYAGTDFSAQL